MFDITLLSVILPSQFTLLSFATNLIKGSAPYYEAIPWKEQFSLAYKNKIKHGIHQGFSKVEPAQNSLSVASKKTDSSTYFQKAIHYRGKQQAHQT